MNKKAKPDTEAKATFEQQLEQLEEIAEKLSSGDIPLDKAIEEYERGVKLLKQCHEMLDKAEKKIKTLVRSEDGDLEERDFTADDPEEN